MRQHVYGQWTPPEMVTEDADITRLMGSLTTTQREEHLAWLNSRVEIWRDAGNIRAADSYVRRAATWQRRMDALRGGAK
jgi:hypothetical protein